MFYSIKSWLHENENSLMLLLQGVLTGTWHNTVWANMTLFILSVLLKQLLFHTKESDQFK